MSEQNNNLNTTENEKVFTMLDYWDRPLNGLCNLYGKPHIYDKFFNEELQGHEEFYYLRPVVDEKHLSLLLEFWDIWVRYISAFNQDKLSPQDEHPCLAVDKKRHDELEEIFNGKSTKYPKKLEKSDVNKYIKAKGRFARRNIGVDFAPPHVTWSNIEYGPEYSVLNFLPETGFKIKGTMNDLNVVTTTDESQ